MDYVVLFIVYVNQMQKPPPFITAEAWMLFQKKGGGNQPMAWRMRAAMSSTVPRPSMTFCLPWAA